eukprot:1021058-Pelagomonas_calceolata.AAC.5
MHVLAAQRAAAAAAAAASTVAARAQGRVHGRAGVGGSGRTPASAPVSAAGTPEHVAFVE